MNEETKWEIVGWMLYFMAFFGGIVVGIAWMRIQELSKPQEVPTTLLTKLTPSSTETWFLWQPKIEIKTELDFYKLDECSFVDEFKDMSVCRIGNKWLRVKGDYDVSKFLTQ